MHNIPNALSPFHYPLKINIKYKITASSSSSSSSSAAPVSSPVSSPVSPPAPASPPVHVRINSVWYDLTSFCSKHPGGPHWLSYYHGRDATEVMDAFHSTKGRKMVDRMRRVKSGVELEELEGGAADDSDVTVNFRRLRERLEEEGWFVRDYKHEFKLMGIWLSLLGSAAFFANNQSDYAGSWQLSTFLLGLFYTQSGWLGHDYVHGVDDFSNRFRQLTTLFAGLGVTWWSDKHNKHHALTNEIGVDEDIATDPFLYTWPPDPRHDSPLRKIQHLIFFVPFSALFALWRWDSFNVAVEAVESGRPGAKDELKILVLHYFIMLSLFPLNVFLPSVILSGLMSALIVTPTHQSEEMFESYQPQWAEAQFLSTRSAVMSNPFSEWIWGGMQYQLEHHLFPTMPRSKYPKLRPILIDFAEENGIEGGYRSSGEFEILKMNWELYRDVAKADPVVGAPYSRGHGQLGSIAPIAINDEDAEGEGGK